MKILLLNNRAKVPLEDDLTRAYNWLTLNTPLKYELKYDFVDIDLEFMDMNMPTHFYGTKGTMAKLKPLIKSDYDIVVFLYGAENDKTPDGHQLTAWNFLEQINGMEYIEIPCSVLGDKVGWIGDTIIHEVMHSIVKLVNRKGGKVIDYIDTIDAPNGNYKLTLNSLKPYWGVLTQTTKYKYFSEKEVKGLNPELVLILDKMRGECGFPFVINSGFRTKAENAKLKDAVADSAHTLGLAVDIKCPDSSKRMKMISSAFLNGIKRIGIGDTYLHFDIDKSKPQGVVWLY